MTGHGPFQHNDKYPRQKSVRPDFARQVAEVNEQIAEAYRRSLLDPWHVKSPEEWRATMEHSDGRKCSVSYGWCFTHMSRALPSPPAGEAVGPFDVPPIDLEDDDR